ncbi:MAG: hypothetical protein RL268_171 [Pseudomonadota bacterium]|jgi:hypothetical protein
MSGKQVCQRKPINKTKLSSALGAAWGRVSHEIGKGTFADKADFDEVTISRAMRGPSLPSAEHLLNSLCADQSALDEVLALYGLAIKPRVSQAANDMELAAGLGHGLSELIDRLRDGRRCHLDTLALAELFRRVIPQLQAIVDEADSIRGAA